MINFFALGLNQIITLAEQMQRLESELFRIFLRNVSASTEQLGSITQMGSRKIVEISEETTKGAEQAAAQMERTARTAERETERMAEVTAEEVEDEAEGTRQAISSRAKASPSRSRSKAQPKRAARKR